MCCFSARAAKYGDTADECGEAFFLCGKSLLELARLVSLLIANFGNLLLLDTRECQSKTETKLIQVASLYLQWVLFFL